MSVDCIFCKIVEKKIPSEIVYEDDFMLAFRDRFPKAPVHILIIPKIHVAGLNDINDKDYDMLAKIMLKIKDIAAGEGIDEDGYRVVANCNNDGGQEVFHLHFHLMGGRVFSWPPG